MGEDIIETTEEVVVEKIEKTETEILKEKNDALESEIERGKQLKAKVALGGESIAGQSEIPVVPETDEEYTERVMKGEVDLTK